MSHHFSPDVAQVDDDPRERSWFARLVAPEGGSTPTTVAFLLGALGTAAFIGSLATDWVTVSLAPVSSSNSRSGAADVAVDVPGTTTTVFMLGLLYSAGVVALIGYLGTVINRPLVALRSRMGATGLGVGLLGVVIGSVLRLPTELERGTTEAVTTTVGYQVGTFYAIAATVLPVVAVWLAASPAARAVAATYATTYATDAATVAAERIAPAEEEHQGRTRIIEPTATPSMRPIFAPPGPVDLTVIPDADRR